MNNKIHEIYKINAITEEVEASFNFIAFGLKSLKEQSSPISNNHVSLQLLASGFERIAKILLLLKEKHVIGQFSELPNTRKKFNKYGNGHGILEMIDELILYAKTVREMQTVPMVKEDLEFIEFDPSFQKFLNIITQFSIQHRYYYIDTIVSDTFNSNFNPFSNFKAFIYSFGDDLNLNHLSYEQEERLLIEKAVICIEKGARGISRFFTHGLGGIGRQSYNNFSSFIFLNEQDLGLLEYTKKKKYPSDSYKPINLISFSFTKILFSSKSKPLSSSNFENWPFFVERVRVYSIKKRYYFVQVGWKVFSLTGLTSSHYKVPGYLKSDKLKPKAYALFLLETAKQL